MRDRLIKYGHNHSLKIKIGSQSQRKPLITSTQVEKNTAEMGNLMVLHFSTGQMDWQPKCTALKNGTACINYAYSTQENAVINILLHVSFSDI